MRVLGHSIGRTFASIHAIIAGAAFNSKPCAERALDGGRCDDAFLSSSRADYAQAVSILSPHRSERYFSPVEPAVRFGADLLSYFFFGFASLADFADTI